MAFFITSTPLGLEDSLKRRGCKTVSSSQGIAGWYTKIIPWLIGRWWTSRSRNDLCCNKTQILLAEDVWWDRQIFSILLALSTDQTTSPCKAVNPSATTLGLSFQSLAYIYILSGLPTTKDKYKHILVVVDSYSKWMEAHSLRSQGATEVAAVLYREVTTRYGAPRTLISDRGQTFMYKLTAAICELFQITRHYGSAYHPQSNSVVEKQILLYCKALICIVKISRMTGQKSYGQSGWHIERCHEPGIAGLTSFPPVR